MKGTTGKVTKKADGFEVKLERTLPFSVEMVWDAITTPEKLRLWFTDIEMEFVPQGKIMIRFRDEARTESFGKIIRIEPLKVFEYTWEDELATWELFPEGKERCRLILTYSKLPDQYAISVPAGWHILLDQLEEVLGGREKPYPFGGEETAEAIAMKEIYSAIVLKEFPELKTS